MHAAMLLISAIKSAGVVGEGGATFGELVVGHMGWLVGIWDVW